MDCGELYEALTEEGGAYASSVTVESDANGFHTITCNKTDVATGAKSTTYQARVKSPHVVTRVIVDNDDSIFDV